MTQFYYYLYLIKFNDGRYYIGSRKSKCKPEEDTKYMGSPVTFKELWTDSNFIKKKYIIKEVNSVEELRRIEPKLIKDAWRKDGKDICLNRHASPHFHTEVCINAGKRTYELGVGAHALTKEQQSENGKLGGKISGKRTHELRVGIHSLTSEEKSKAGKMGAKTTVERYSREFALISPNGKVFQERNLRKFCREHGLDSSNVRRVLNGTQLTSKGWTRLV